MNADANLELELGKRIKGLRKAKGWTLKELSQASDLSVSFLSQLERGQTSTTIYSLKSLAHSLDVDVAQFFNSWEMERGPILRSYEQKGFRLEKSNFVYHRLANNFEGRVLDPMLVILLPGDRKDVWAQPHQGEEFVYVLEGKLNLFIEGEEHILYPGDSVHMLSHIPHDWANFTNQIVKILSVNTPVLLD